MPADTAPTNSGEYVRNYYRVPSEVDVRVVFDGKPGVITGFTAAYVLVLLDGATESVPVHPTWRMTYLPAATEELSRG
jgi:hypothetical protein